MKKLSLLLSLSLLTSFAFSQINITELERVDGLWTKKGESKPFNGDFKETFENGKTKGSGTFTKGQLEGLRVQYFPNGNKQTEKNYKDSYPHGTAKEFYENGTLKQVGEFVNNKESGIWTMYYLSGNKHIESTFVNGVQHGKYMEYSELGNLLLQYYFTDGKASYSPDFMKLSKEAVQLSREFKNKEAIKIYDKAIEINPTIAQVYFNRGACKGSTFDFEGAIADYDKALELNPEYMEAYGNRGNAKINIFTSKGTLKPTSEQTQSACEDFNKAKELGDNSMGTEDMIYLYCKENLPVNALTYNATETTKGSLSIQGKILDSNKIGLLANINIEFKNGSYKIDGINIFSDSAGVFGIILKNGVKHKLIVSADNYNPKVIIVDTRKGGEHEEGYLLPIEITLEKKGKNIVKLKPIGIVFYNKETDLYDSKPYK